MNEARSFVLNARSFESEETHPYSSEAKKSGVK
jgi:hypothetical protein